MTLGECTRGDIVLIVWPAHEYEHESQLVGCEVLVKVGGFTGFDETLGTCRYVFVQRFDRELFVVPRSMRTLPRSLEVLEVVLASQWRKLSKDEERYIKSQGDIADPMMRNQ